MSLHTVTCPRCRTRLKSDQPIPSGVRLDCPDCEASFTAPDELPPPGPRLIGPAFFIAVSVATILGASIVLAAALLGRPSPSPVAVGEGSDRGQPSIDEERRHLDEQRRALEHVRLLARGEAALGREKYAEAEEAFAKAVELIPGDTQGAKGLAAARAGLAAAKAAAGEQGKRQGEADGLLARAKQAQTDGNFDLALRLLRSARDLAPTDRRVLDALAAAQNASDADQRQKRTREEHRRLMDAARASLMAERFTDALRDYQGAVRLLPDDLEAQQGVKQAEAKLAGIADGEKRQGAFENLLERGRKAQRERRFTDAVTALESALRLMPDDREAARLRRSAQEALKQARSRNGRLLGQAEEALRLGRLEESRRLAEEALENWPEDARAQKAVRSAERIVGNVRAGQAAFLRLLDQGALATATGRNADAVVAYVEALRLAPGDATVLRLLRNARQARDADLRGVLDYDRLVKAGTAALSRKAYADASKAFSDALQLVANDPLASDGLSRARFGLAMSEGEKALRLKRRGDAVRAFEAALAEKPDDVLASTGLKRAKVLR